MRYLIIFSYDGSNYNGYQRQSNHRTIQGTIEEALRVLNRGKAVNLVASGRTDSKVHAAYQTAHVDLDYRFKDLMAALNSLLPDDIYIKRTRLMDDSFHARYHVASKTYQYQINTLEYNPIRKDYVYQYCKPLNVEDMKYALKALEGQHNFKSFAKTDITKEDYVRTIIKTNIKEENGIITITIKGTGFFRHMVRNIVGTLIEVGEGKRDKRCMKEILDKQDRVFAGKTAHAEGLCLMEVEY